jgi:hypothetical protein
MPLNKSVPEFVQIAVGVVVFTFLIKSKTDLEEA